MTLDCTRDRDSWVLTTESRHALSLCILFCLLDAVLLLRCRWTHFDMTILHLSFDHPGWVVYTFLLLCTARTTSVLPQLLVERRRRSNCAGRRRPC